MTGEDFLEVGREYFLDKYKDETGHFVGADLSNIYFTRGKGSFYELDLQGFISFPRGKVRYESVNNEI
jgi:hypothetical protein